LTVTADRLASDTRPTVTPSPASEKTEIEIVGGPGGVSLGAARELWLFREVLSAFVVRHVKVKYKQAAIGIGWSVLQPVVAAALFALFLGRFANVSSDGLPYFAFALAGMVAWSSFSGAVGTAMESLVADQVLLRKVYFPREVLPLAAVGAVLVDLVPALATLFVAVLLYGIAPSLTWIAVVVPILVIALSAAGIGMALAALNVYYRDVRYALPFLLQIGLFATPVVYPLDVVPAGWREAYAILNPVAAAIDALRHAVVGGSWPEPLITGGALAWSLVLLGGGYTLFKRLERGFSDRI
jgi:lipopolysaccharide transport system permease protein